MVKKINFGEKNYRPPFIGTYKVDILDIFMRRKIDPKTKKIMQEKMTLIKGGPIPCAPSEIAKDRKSVVLSI